MCREMYGVYCLEMAVRYLPQGYVWMGGILECEE